MSNPETCPVCNSTLSEHRQCLSDSCLKSYVRCTYCEQTLNVDGECPDDSCLFHILTKKQKLPSFHMTEEADRIPASERTTLVVDTPSRCPNCGAPFESGLDACLPCSRAFGSDKDEDNEDWIPTIRAPPPEPQRKPAPSTPDIEIGEIISEDDALREFYEPDLDEDAD